MIRLLLALLMPVVCLTAATEGGYTLLPLSLLADRARWWPPGIRILTTGTYRPDSQYERLVKGMLVDGPYFLRLLGEAFDWLPAAGTRIDARGVLRQDRDVRYLEFYNGRLAGDRTRAPLPTPVLQPGDELELVVRVRQVGNVPFVHWVAQTEDRVTIRLAAMPAPDLPSGTIARVRLRVRSTGATGIVADALSVTPLPGALPPSPGG